MAITLSVGILALQGGVAEHVEAFRKAARKTKLSVSLRTVRTARELEGLHAIVIPGGESTTLSVLLENQGLLEPIRRLPSVFGTCAGLILMAEGVDGAEQGQKSLHLMPVVVSRNAYGSQADSFESALEGGLTGKTRVIFIRAPKIVEIGAGVEVLARLPATQEPAIVGFRPAGHFYLGAACHPELTTGRVHEYFLRELMTALSNK